ncbi:hypothetical protein BJ875DRAFT_90957 [Amylocarpus encephaloides]|uniref:C2H2-type domain-containing protein n=1 Tax=Amylocarpus encephaloides TaxID=45428 RepID=A0A9P7YEK1_9HELO|nr:hypothetical protein BJ875DRAFT_90957 [Amylocarpus encephaloides]
MTTVEQHHLHDPPRDDIYDSDDGRLKSPPLIAMNVNLKPDSPKSLMPPPLTLDSKSGASDSKAIRRYKVIPSQSDAGLVSMMANGRSPDIARIAGTETLEPYINGEDGGEEVIALAAKAVAMIQMPQSKSHMKPTTAEVRRERIVEEVRRPGDSMGEGRHRMPSIPVGGPRHMASPETPGRLDMKSPGSEEKLAPIRSQSPNSAQTNGNGAAISLPPFKETLAKIGQSLPETPDSHYAHSPPAVRSLFPSLSNHGSPPKSPNDTFRRELPSPGRGIYPYNSNGYRRPSQSESTHYSSAADYSGSNTETPSSDASTANPAIDRMSIDGITNPQIGGFQCSYPGCIAQPFQTQYLLNSHANVHSSNRPHYCSVKGCPRSESGKGFKRKNEMIRHGLVHDSPGYVCPFCPDREHKYPRPDNLQRHVRVHHLDKAKDDNQLRDVLSQRPEGPSRGRRRRGVTS